MENTTLATSPKGLSYSIQSASGKPVGLDVKPKINDEVHLYSLDEDEQSSRYRISVIVSGIQDEKYVGSVSEILDCSTGDTHKVRVVPELIARGRGTDDFDKISRGVPIELRENFLLGDLIYFKFENVKKLQLK